MDGTKGDVAGALSGLWGGAGDGHPRREAETESRSQSQSQSQSPCPCPRLCPCPWQAINVPKPINEQPQCF